MAAPRKTTAKIKAAPAKTKAAPAKSAPAAKKTTKAAAPLQTTEPVAPERKQRSTAGRKRDRRLAEVVAEQIREEIVALGWPVGKVLGSEADLLARYQVSRSVFRQAVRLLEYNHIARMRPGPGSGLIVTEPDSAATRKTLSVFLEYKKVSVDHILEAMNALEMACVKLATERITADGVKKLRDAIEREHNTPLEEVRNTTENNVHILLAELTGNPALHLFVEVLTALSLTHAPKRITKKLVDQTAHVHSEVADAVISGDVALAMHRMRRHLDELSDALY
jgi:DNA-binding FadR family transcriptional regulator